MNLLAPRAIMWQYALPSLKHYHGRFSAAGNRVQAAAIMENAGDLGIYSEVPFLDKLQRSLTFLLRMVFANPVAILLRDFGYVVFMAVIVSQAARASSSSAFFRVAIIIALIVSLFIWGGLLTRYLVPHISRLVFGPPVFGTLGGLQRRTFFTAVRCAAAMKFKFAPADSEKVRCYGRIDRELTERLLRSRYQEILAKNGPAELTDFDKRWSEVWNGQVLAIEVKVGPNQFIKYEEVFAEDNIALRIEPLKLDTVTYLIAPIVKMINFVMVYLLCRYLDAQINLLTVVQVGLFLSLIVCLILFNYHAHQNAEIPFVGSLTKDTPEDIGNRIKEFIGQTVRPTRITVKKRYLSLIQSYFSTVIAFITFLNTLSALFLVGVVLSLTLAWQPGGVNKILHWYRGFSIGLLLIPAGLVATYHLMFLILQNFKLVLAPIIVGLLTVFLPYAFTYLAGGRVDLNQVKNAYLAVATGLATGLTATITSRLKKMMEGNDEEEEKERKERKGKSATARQ